MAKERIAKAILSALLKKEVVSIQAHPHEYSNQTRDNISMFRIDFSALRLKMSEEQSTGS